MTKIMDSGDMSDDIPHGFIVDEQYIVHGEDVLDQEENIDCGGKNTPLREQDRFLPIANIAKIMKRAIPENGKIAKDARECVQECISEFISFITSEASDRCQVEKRKTINGEDVLFAMNSLGFDNYVEPLKSYLTKYREMVLSPMFPQWLLHSIIPFSCQTEEPPGTPLYSRNTTFKLKNYAPDAKIHTKCYEQVSSTLPPEITLNKITKMVYDVHDGSESNPETADTEGEEKSESAVLYAYPNKVIGDYTIG